MLLLFDSLLFLFSLLLLLLFLLLLILLLVVSVVISLEQGCITLISRNVNVNILGNGPEQLIPRLGNYLMDSILQLNFPVYSLESVSGMVSFAAWKYFEKDFSNTFRFDYFSGFRTKIAKFY